LGAVARSGDKTSVPVITGEDMVKLFYDYEVGVKSQDVMACKRARRNG